MSTEKMRAVMLAADEGRAIECREVEKSVWRSAPLPCWNWRDYEYRVKPEPKRVPRTLADLPQGGALWVRHGDVTAFAVVNVNVRSLGTLTAHYQYDTEYPGLEISSDRKTWLPWWKEVEA